MKDHRYNRGGQRVNKSHLLAWAAGFFDGEGYVGLRRNNGYGGIYLTASVTQKDRRLLERFQQIVERGGIGKPGKTGISSLAFTNSQDVLILFELLAPYLGPQKTEQFQAAFTQWFAYRTIRGRTKG